MATTDAREAPKMTAAEPSVATMTARSDRRESPFLIAHSQDRHWSCSARDGTVVLGSCFRDLVTFVGYHTWLPRLARRGPSPTMKHFHSFRLDTTNQC